MKIYNSLNEFKKLDNAIVTIGTFDGLHLGHQKIFARLNEISRETDGETVVITFWPHPRKIISSDKSEIKLLSTIQEKKDQIERLGINHLLILPFNREFSELSPKQYIQEILKDRIGTRTLVIGYDHRFGKNREGNFNFLKENQKLFQLEIVEIPKQEIINSTISSTKVREALAQGNINLANKLLGKRYSISGIVQKGRQLGRTLGFPTANINVDSNDKLIPKNGVYAVNVYIRNKEKLGIMNIGTRPTVNGQGRSLEVYIFDFNEDIYGEKIKVEFLYFIRDEKKFDSVDSLVEQINKDCEFVKNKTIE